MSEPRDPALAAFAEIADAPRCVWLDGGGGRHWSGHRSLVAALEPDDLSLTFDAAAGEVRAWRGAPGRWRSEVVGDDVFAVLEGLVAERPDARWLGYWGYGARPDLPGRPDPLMPDAVWMRPSRVRELVHPASGPTPPTTGPVEPAASARQPVEEPAPEWYRAAFDEVQRALRDGDSYQVNLTYRIAARARGGPAEVYRRLRALNPAPYGGFLQHAVDDARASAWLAGSSPERFARISPTAGGRLIEAKPMKGTAPRAGDDADDRAARAALAADPKNRAENLMIVDLLRNDVGAVAVPGSVRVPSLMAVETYASVHQMVSEVHGLLRPEVGTVAALRALFPAGSMTGAPRLRTMQIIDRVETDPRGAYSGALGWVDGRGRADLGVLIRSLASADGHRWTVGTGGGVTVRSTASQEYAESRWKASRLLRALTDER